MDAHVCGSITTRRDASILAYSHAYVDTTASASKAYRVGDPVTACVTTYTDASISGSSMMRLNTYIPESSSAFKDSSLSLYFCLYFSVRADNSLLRITFLA